MSSQKTFSNINNQVFSFPSYKKQSFVFFFLRSLVLNEFLKYVLSRKFQIFSTPFVLNINNSNSVLLKFSFLEPFSFSLSNRLNYFYKQRLLDFTLNRFSLQQKQYLKQKKAVVIASNLFLRFSVLQSKFISKLLSFSAFFKFRFWSIEFSRSLFLVFFMSCICKRVSLLGSFLAFIFERIPSNKHHSFLTFFENFLLNFSLSFRSFFFKEFKGLKIIVNGRLQGSDRTKKRLISFGKTSRNLQNQEIDFCFLPSCSVLGVFGIKCWFFLSKKPENKTKFMVKKPISTSLKFNNIVYSLFAFNLSNKQI